MVSTMETTSSMVSTMVSSMSSIRASTTSTNMGSFLMSLSEPGASGERVQERRVEGMCKEGRVDDGAREEVVAELEALLRIQARLQKVKKTSGN